MHWFNPNSNSANDSGKLIMWWCYSDHHRGQANFSCFLILQRTLQFKQRRYLDLADLTRETHVYLDKLNIRLKNQFNYVLPENKNVEERFQSCLQPTAIGSMTTGTFLNILYWAKIPGLVEFLEWCVSWSRDHLKVYNVNLMNSKNNWNYKC